MEINFLRGRRRLDDAHRTRTRDSLGGATRIPCTQSVRRMRRLYLPPDRWQSRRGERHFTPSPPGRSMDRLETPIDASETPPARFLRYAEACRTLELERLIVAADLVKGIGALIHSLQRERGVSSIFLGSNGGRFGDRRDAQARESRELERRARARLERIDEKLDRTSLGARFYV